MTKQDALQIFEQALASLDAYIATQVTDAQIGDAKHQKHSLSINKNYLISNLVGDAPYHICKSCGTIELSRFTNSTASRLRANQVCFHCDFWEQVAITPAPERLVVDGRVYSDGGHSPGARSDFLGFGGHLWTIRQGDRVWTTNNLWSGGIIPNEFRDRLPDNAEFIK